MDKQILTEEQPTEIDVAKVIEEFKARGGMSDEELQTRLKAIPFEEFMRKLDKRIETIK
ncbi:MAG: hypothetical protein KBT32_08240 [Bacteroidales bacterium]|nr:hypothetical protein [Candidatus Physcocola equi]